MKTTAPRLAFLGLLIILSALCSPLASANCGGCGGDKKECPTPTPAPSPAR